MGSGFGSRKASLSAETLRLVWHTLRDANEIESPIPGWSSLSLLDPGLMSAIPIRMKKEIQPKA